MLWCLKGLELLGVLPSIPFLVALRGNVQHVEQAL